jgi:hypothetical protein
MKELFNTILTRIKTEVTEIKHIDFEMGQIESLGFDIRPPIDFPAALIDISYPRCEDIGGLMQQVEARVTVKLAFESPLPTDSRASEVRRTAALTIFDVVDKVYACLQGYSSSEFSSLSRSAQTPDNRYAGIKIINMVFSTTFEDSKAIPVVAEEEEGGGE